MGIYKQGLNRKQQLMFPPSLDELVEEDNVVRAIEAYVDTLNIFKLNIKTKKSLIKDGQPAFHPKLLLKIYHFLVRTKKKVLGENALIMFTYNFKRLLNLIGIALFQKLCIAIKENDLSKIREDIAAYILAFGVHLAYFLEIFLFLQNIPKKMRYLKN